MRILLLCCILVTFSLNLFGQKIAVNKIEKLDLSDTGAFFYPQFSPDGNKLYFTSANYHGMWQLDLPTSQLAQINNYSGAGLSPVFTQNGEYLIFKKEEYLKHKKYSSIVAYNLKTKSETVLEETNRSLTLPFLSTSGELVYKKKNKYYSFKQDLSDKTEKFTGKIIDSNKSNLILLENGSPNTLNVSVDTKFLWASLSPDQSKILFTKAGTGTFISDLLGNILVELGNANAPVWSPDGKWVVYMDDEDNGYHYTSSEIFIISENGTQKLQVTNTDNEIEMYPKWAPSGDKIVFNTNTGIIKIAYLVFE